MSAAELALKTAEIVFKDRMGDLKSAKAAEAKALAELRRVNLRLGIPLLSGVQDMSEPQEKKAARKRVVASGKTKRLWGLK